MVVVDQLREELYDVAKKKLLLEKELSAMAFCIAALKKELELRLPEAPKQY